MEEYLVHEQQVSGPAAHALVIGVGAYPHLPGGGDPVRFAEHDGMGQLSSPPISAAAVADWLVAKAAPEQKLASVTLLVSGREPVTFRNPRTGAEHVVAAATMANVKAAAEQWKRRGDADPDNLMLFYFCGHGMASGPDLALLMQDFGANPDSALDAALDFRLFRLGMERCRARKQCYFVDACRVTASALVAAVRYAGVPIFLPLARRDQSLGLRHCPVFYSTFAGDVAQSRVDQVSLFTEALLNALKGAGADDITNDEWWIDTNQLQKAIQFLMEQGYRLGFPPAQVNPVDDLTFFRLHRIDGQPEVPVVVGCRPASFNQKATLVWKSDTAAGSRAPQADDWTAFLTPGTYQLRADVAGIDPPPTLERFIVRPPYRMAELVLQA